MTNDEAKQLGLRALAAGFRWAHGCLDGVHGFACVGGPDPVFWTYAAAGWSGVGRVWSDDGIVSMDTREREVFAPWPDLRDPATLGVLEAQWRALVGESAYIEPTDPSEAAACEEAGVAMEPFTAMVVVCTGMWATTAAGPTRAHTLVAALEAAKGGDPTPCAPQPIP